MKPGTAKVAFLLPTALFLLTVGPISSQFPPDRFGPGRGFPPGAPPMGGPGPGRNRLRLQDRFDADKDGILDREERRKAREYLSSRGSGPFGRGRGGPRGPFGRRGAVEPKAGPVVEPDQVALFPRAGLYEESVLRTFFLVMPDPKWEEELDLFKPTDLEVPATLMVDGRTLEKVGVRFRGSTSYVSVGKGAKKSFNLTVDHGVPKQDLHGYRTLNLLNSHSDPSFLRTFLFNHIARNYLPAPRTNHVKLVINGESWGIYVNTQQFNQDFCREWFGESKGARWRVPVDFSGGSALVFHGMDPQEYKGRYQLKSKESAAAWQDLVLLCLALTEVPGPEREDGLDAVLNVDRALWFLALDNALADGDGYISRGSDYVMYQDARFKRFHLLPYDSNETFRQVGGPGFEGRRFGGGERPDTGLAPLARVEDSRRPLMKCLLGNPNYRARYLAHLRTITREWLDWKTLGPIVARQRRLIDDEVKKDTKKLFTYQDFRSADTGRGQGGGPGGRPTGLKTFVETRRAFLLNHEDLKRPVPTILDLSRPTAEIVARAAGKGVPITARLDDAVRPDQVLLYFAPARESPFSHILMRDDGREGDTRAGDGVYFGYIPHQPPGSRVHYYVEARAVKSHGTTCFFPPRAEFGALDYRQPLLRAPEKPVVINEVMAGNGNRDKEPRKRFLDWLELYNPGKRAYDLSGRFLSDNKKNLRRWIFPAGTVIPPGGYLLVYGRPDKEVLDALHANFRLSRKGEVLFLSEIRQGRIVLLDLLRFPRQRKHMTFGRCPDGSDQTMPLVPTPGKANRN